MFAFRALVLWLHLGAIVVWVGGLFALAVVVDPVAHRVSYTTADAARMVERAARRFLRISREIVALIILTGLFNLIDIGVLTHFGYGSRFLLLVGLKTVLFVGVVGGQLSFALRMAPRLAALAQGTGEKGREAYRKARRRARLLHAAMLVSAFVALLGGVVLVP